MLYIKHFHHFTLPSDSLYQHGNEAANYPSWPPPPWTETVILPRRTRELLEGHCLDWFAHLCYCVTFTDADSGKVKLLFDK